MHGYLHSVVPSLPVSIDLPLRSKPQRVITMKYFTSCVKTCTITVGLCEGCIKSQCKKSSAVYLRKYDLVTNCCMLIPGSSLVIHSMKGEAALTVGFFSKDDVMLDLVHSGAIHCLETRSNKDMNFDFETLTTFKLLKSITVKLN